MTKSWKNEVMRYFHFETKLCILLLLSSSISAIFFNLKNFKSLHLCQRGHVAVPRGSKVQY